MIFSYEGLTVFSEEAGDNLRRTLLHLMQENEKKQKTIIDLQTTGTKKTTKRLKIFYIYKVKTSDIFSLKLIHDKIYTSKEVLPYM